MLYAQRSRLNIKKGERELFHRILETINWWLTPGLHVIGRVFQDIPRPVQKIVRVTTRVSRRWPTFGAHPLMTEKWEVRKQGTVEILGEWGVERHLRNRFSCQTMNWFIKSTRRRGVEKTHRLAGLSRIGKGGSTNNLETARKQPHRGEKGK